MIKKMHCLIPGATAIMLCAFLVLSIFARTPLMPAAHAADTDGAATTEGGNVAPHESEYDPDASPDSVSNADASSSSDSGPSSSSSSSSNSVSNSDSGSSPNLGLDLNSDEAAQASEPANLEARNTEAESSEEQAGITTQQELQDALNAVASGGTVTLTQDIEISGAPLILPYGKVFTLDGSAKGYSLSLAADYSGRHMALYSSFSAGSHVTLQNLNIQGNGLGGGLLFEGCYQFINPAGSSVALSNCSLSNCYAGGASDMEYQGGALYFTQCNASITGCTFTNNKARSGGALVGTGNSKITIAGSAFTGNAAVEEGGTLKTHGTATFTLSNSHFVSNTAGSYGGVLATVSERHPATLTATGCLFEENQALGQNGGVLYGHRNDLLTFTECTFRSNSAQVSGGALSVFNLTATDCDFVGNRAGRAGGALYVMNGESGNPIGYTFLRGSMVSNSAGTNGGAIYGSGYSFFASASIDGTIFSKNTASTYVYIDFENPLDTKALSSAETLSQSYYGGLYPERYKNITSWSESPFAGHTSQHVINNYDIDAPTFTVFIVCDLAEEEAVWSDGYTGNTRSLRVASGELDALLAAQNIALQKEGCCLTGWQHDNSQVFGYSTKGESFTDIATNHFVRGALVISPVWTEASVLTPEPVVSDPNPSPDPIPESDSAPDTKPTPGPGHVPGPGLSPSPAPAPAVPVVVAPTPPSAAPATTGTAPGAKPEQATPATQSASEYEHEAPGEGSERDLATTMIQEGALPLFYGGAAGTAWALLNFILALSGIILALAAAVKKARSNRRCQSDTAKQRRSSVALAAVVLFALGSLILFMCTENMSSPLVLTDVWTIANLALLGIEIVGVVIASKKAGAPAQE